MSLILDALRKANAERERGSVPSLHSQPVGSHPVEMPPAPSMRPNLLWIAIGVAFGLVAAATWVMVARNAPAPSTATVDLAPARPGVPEATAAQPAAVNGLPPRAAASSDAQVIAEPAPWRQPEERKAPRPDAKADPQVTTLGNVLGNVPPGKAPIYSRDQLPPDIRAALPQFAIGGSVYSSDPTARSLIVNGQLYRERDRLTQDLSLEEIKLKSAIFSTRGYRFEVMF